MSGDPKPISLKELDDLFEQVNNWGRWGEGDERGALNLITPEKRRKASALMQDGDVVSAALPLATQLAPENPSPVGHYMVRAGDLPGDSCADYFAIAPHGMANTHLDALCHYLYHGKMYNGVPASKVTSRGAEANSIEVALDRMVGRGVLLDVARALGRDWLEPGEAIYIEDLEKAEAAQNVRVEEGDILLVRTGRFRRRAQLGGWSPTSGLAGMHGTCMPWLHSRGVAALGCDGVSDVIPSGVEGGGVPIHTVAIPGMGLHLIDNCDLEPLAKACEEKARWEFLFVVAPLKLVKGTASPVNPLAMF